MTPTVHWKATTLLITLVALSACATIEPEETDEQRHKALARWNQCLERNLSEMSDGLVNGSLSLEQACDGHKRDVLMAYPPRMEKALDSYLVQRTRERAVKHMAIDSVEVHTGSESPSVVQAIISR